MKIEDAKTILLSYRATGADASDPAFAEALALARQDPELRAWLERQQHFDRGMMAEMEVVPAPSGLRDAILAAAAKQEASANPAATTAGEARTGDAAAGAQDRDRGRGFMPQPEHGPNSPSEDKGLSHRQSAHDAKTEHAWRRRPSGIWLGLAAAVALLASATVALWPKPKISAVDSSLAAFAVVDAQNPKTHGGHGEEAKELNRTLNTTTTHLGDTLPVDFQALHDTGCRTVHVEGRDVLEMCFRRNGVQFHCYIARRGDFPTVTAPTAPVVATKNGAGVATWGDTKNLYIVVSKPGPAPLEKLL